MHKTSAETGLSIALGIARSPDATIEQKLEALRLVAQFKKVKPKTRKRRNPGPSQTVRSGILGSK